MKILILAYYNPWISGGGHRPICLCEEDIARGDEVVFLFESDSEIDQMNFHCLILTDYDFYGETKNQENL